MTPVSLFAPCLREHASRPSECVLPASSDSGPSFPSHSSRTPAASMFPEPRSVLWVRLCLFAVRPGTSAYIDPGPPPPPPSPYRASHLAVTWLSPSTHLAVTPCNTSISNHHVLPGQAPSTAASQPDGQTDQPSVRSNIANIHGPGDLCFRITVTTPAALLRVNPTTRGRTKGEKKGLRSRHNGEEPVRDSVVSLLGRFGRPQCLSEPRVTGSRVTRWFPIHFFVRPHSAGLTAFHAARDRTFPRRHTPRPST